MELASPSDQLTKDPLGLGASREDDFKSAMPQRRLDRGIGDYLPIDDHGQLVTRGMLAGHKRRQCRQLTDLAGDEPDNDGVVPLTGEDLG
jgi:hypothetical protein